MAFTENRIYGAFTEQITPSSSDKPLIGPAHSPGNKGAGYPRQKVQTERLIGPFMSESGRPARTARVESSGRDHDPLFVRSQQRTLPSHNTILYTLYFFLSSAPPDNPSFLSTTIRVYYRHACGAPIPSLSIFVIFVCKCGVPSVNNRGLGPSLS